MGVGQVAAAIGAITAPVAGSIISNVAQKRAADRQNRFTERMSSTTHQREIEDLKKAGLNPILSVNQGSPSAQGTMPKYENPMAGVANSALSFSKLQGELENLSANSDLAKSLANKADEEAITQGTIRDLNTATQVEKYHGVMETLSRIRRVNQEVENLVEENSRIIAQTNLTNKQAQMLGYDKQKKEFFSRLYDIANDLLNLLQVEKGGNKWLNDSIGRKVQGEANQAIELIERKAKETIRSAKNNKSVVYNGMRLLSIVNRIRKQIVKNRSK